ncbi:GumC family protein [Qipengyuania zhejiangensis]|uniref:GumC family protein n=1 Tax=Qipengyuania zhejiangensis TaxID=3077782 RepID=UPI002D797556|nr:division plane positioning ATPase MipZ [Qipengyuania sp. Z2]
MNVVKSGNGEGFLTPALPGPVDYQDEVGSPHGLLSVLRRRLRLILAVVFAVMAVTSLWLWFATPIYSATAVMELDAAVGAGGSTDPNRPPPVSELEQQEDYSARVQMEALKSRPVARKVIADLGLLGVEEFNGGVEPVADLRPEGSSATQDDLSTAMVDGEDTTSDPRLAGVPAETIEAAIDSLLSAISVEQAGNSNFIVITAKSENPQRAMDIANAIVDSYTENRTAEIAELNSRLLADLGERTEELSDRLKGAEYKVAEFKRRNGIDSSFAEAAGAAEIQGAAAAISSARGESAMASAAAARQRAAGAARSPLLDNLRNRESALESQLANLSTQYGARHPDVMRVTAELREVKQAVAAEAARASAAVESERAGANARAGQIASDLGGLRARARRQDMANPELAALEREVQTSNSLYLSMLERVTELQLRSDNPRPEAIPVSTALLPDSPSFPKPRQTLAVAMAAAVILGVFLAMVMESFDNRIRSGDQIRRITSLPTFAMIPQKGTIPNEMEGPEDAGNTPRSIFAEAFRDGFLEIVSRVNGENSRVIMVTSALPGEGKSTVSLGVALSALGQGMRAIVLDFDFRRRGLTKMLGLEDHPQGLDTYLKGQTDLDGAISNSARIPQLASMTVTGMPDNPASMFDTNKLLELFAQLRARYDFIVIDTPPVMALRDAKVLAAYADGSVMTARWGKSSPDTLKSVMQVLGNNLIGAVITRVNYAKHARFAYGDALQYYSKYSYYYDDDFEERTFIQRVIDSIRRKFRPA